MTYTEIIIGRDVIPSTEKETCPRVLLPVHF